MIRDRNAQTLFMDFSNVRVPMGRPSDIDMFYIVPREIDDVVGGFTFFAEIKYENAEVNERQEKLYERLVDNCKNGAVALFVTHNKMWQRGDDSVDVGDCVVRKYYYNGKWRWAKHELTVNEAISQMIAFERMERLK